MPIHRMIAASPMLDSRRANLLAAHSPCTKIGKAIRDSNLNNMISDRAVFSPDNRGGRRAASHAARLLVIGPTGMKPRRMILNVILHILCNVGIFSVQSK